MTDAFRILLPAGWQRIDLTRDINADEIIRGWGIERNMPTALRGQLVQSVTASLEHARSMGAVCLVVPVDPEFGGTTTLMFRPWTGGENPLDDLLALVASDPSAMLLDVPDLLCVRNSRARPRDTSGLDSFTDIQASSTRVLREIATTLQVRYILGDPTEAAHWVEVIGGIGYPDDEAGREALEALLILADTIVQTFRWEA